MEEEYPIVDVDKSQPPSLSDEKQKVGQEQIHDLLLSDKLSWQAIIYDLINTEQLDPWDIDIALLAQKFLGRIRELEEANFFISSKVLMATAFLLRIKTEILLNEEIQSLDEILFGKKEEKRYQQERIELEDDIPQLVARTPLPRFKKVTLHELLAALGKAIKTENRRIQRVVIVKQQEFEATALLPKKRINIHERIREVYAQLKKIFAKKETKLAFSELAGTSIEERVATFIPLLHLDNQHKIWLKQEGHFTEIWILLKHIYEKQNAGELKAMRNEVEAEMKKWSETLSKEEKERAEKLEMDFPNPLENKEEQL